MGPGHKKPDVYRLATDYVAWVCEKAAPLAGIHRLSLGATEIDFGPDTDFDTEEITS